MSRMAGATDGGRRMAAVNLDDVDEEPSFDLDVQEYIRGENLDAVDEGDIFEILEQAEERARSSSPPPLPEKIELEKVILDRSVGLVEPGDVVELHHSSDAEDRDLPRGDFLLVRQIKEELETGDISFCGYRLRRTAHMAPMFNRRTNELFMLLHTRKDDTRPVYEQALEEVGSEEVFRKRECLFTHLRDGALTTVYRPAIPAGLTSSAQKLRWLFNKGMLVCRWVHVVGQYHYSKVSYAGESRMIYRRECEEFQKHARTRPPSASQSQEAPRSQGKPQSDTPRQQSCCDFFCGIGGVSEGARQVDLRVHLGLERDDTHMETYEKNFPDAQCLLMDAQDFAGYASRECHGGDHCHFSCPCKYWSMCHTIEGKDDEANRNIIFTAAPMLEKLKPITFSSEQTPGFLIIEAHNQWFRTFVNTILAAGYNVRWEIQDQAWFGTSQYRPRLIFLGAKIGHPIPPFPKPEYGPDGSGLKRYRTVHDALAPLRQPGLHLRNNKYHQPDSEKAINGMPYNPRTNMSPTLTTKGSIHYSGLRANTPVELLLLQGFPMDYKLGGSKTKAREGACNAWPPISNKRYLLLCAATTEAYENGFIDNEEHIDDLYETLEKKDIVIPASAIGYRYLRQLKKSAPLNAPLMIFGKRKELAPAPRNRQSLDDFPRNRSVTPRMRSMSLKPSVKEESSRPRTSKQKRSSDEVEDELRKAKRRGNFLEID